MVRPLVVPAVAPVGRLAARRSNGLARLAAGLVALGLVLAVGAACSSDNSKGGGSGRTNNVPETLTPVTPAHQAGTTHIATTTVPATNSQGVALPAAPNDYATAAYDAWRKGDRSTAAVLAEEPAAASLFAKPFAATDKWTFANCSGKAGGSYCTWRSGKHTLTIRVVNARLGQAQAVNAATFS